MCKMDVCVKFTKMDALDLEYIYSAQLYLLPANEVARKPSIRQNLKVDWEETACSLVSRSHLCIEMKCGSLERC